PPTRLQTAIDQFDFVGARKESARAQSHIEQANSVEKFAPESHIRAHQEGAAVGEIEILPRFVRVQRHGLQLLVCEQHFSAEYAQAGISAEFAVNLIEPVLAHQYVIIREDKDLASCGGDGGVARIGQSAPPFNQLARRFGATRRATLDDLVRL